MKPASMTGCDALGLGLGLVTRRLGIGNRLVVIGLRFLLAGAFLRALHVLAAGLRFLVLRVSAVLGGMVVRVRIVLPGVAVVVPGVDVLPRVDVVPAVRIGMHIVHLRCSRVDRMLGSVARFVGECGACHQERARNQPSEYLVHLNPPRYRMALLGNIEW